MPRAERLRGASSPEPLLAEPHPGLLRGALHAAYDLAWVAAGLLGTPWLLWRGLRGSGVGGAVLARLGRGLGGPPGGGSPRVLLHGVSVGEVKGARCVADAIEERYPGIEVVLSTTTDTGLELARKLFPPERVVRFPADLSPVVRRFLRRVRPAFVVLIELEIWPNFLRECNRAAIPVAVVNGRITERSHARYRLFRKLLPQFDRISLFCVQSEEYAERFRRLDVRPERLFVTGNVKADGLRTGPVEPGEELRRLLSGRPGQPVVVAGSTHAPEESWVAEAWRAAAPEARLVLVPRHPPRTGEVVRDLAELGIGSQLLSRLRTGETPDPSRPAVVDTIGELERVYGLADLVFVGGSLIPHGGQNMLEPAAQGRPVLFGPHVENFTQEAALLLAAGACREVEGPEALAASLALLLGDAGRREAMGRAGREAVLRQRGATRITLEALGRLFLDGLARRGSGVGPRPPSV